MRSSRRPATRPPRPEHQGRERHLVVVESATGSRTSQVPSALLPLPSLEDRGMRRASPRQRPWSSEALRGSSPRSSSPPRWWDDVRRHWDPIRHRSQHSVEGGQWAELDARRRHARLAQLAEALRSRRRGSGFDPPGGHSSSGTTTTKLASIGCQVQHMLTLIQVRGHTPGAPEPSPVVPHLATGLGREALAGDSPCRWLSLYTVGSALPAW